MKHQKRPSARRPARRAKTSVVGVIPARWGSTRFPGKALAPIAGKPLIQWVIERSCRARKLDRLLVATDDIRIRDAVRKLGVQVVMTRKDHPSGTDRIAEAAARARAAILINIQGDEPLIDPRLIDRLADVMVREPEWDMATAATPIRDPADVANPAVVKVVWGRDGQALYFSRSAIPFEREKGSGAGVKDPLYWRHIGIYAYRRSFLEKLVRTSPCALEQTEKLEQLRALWLGCRMRILQTQDIGVGVDTPEDVARAERALKKNGLLG